LCGLENFSPVKRAEKPHVIAFKFQPELKYELRHAHRLSCECETLSYKRFPPSFKHCTRAEIHHVIARKFQPGGWTEISARAKIRHEIARKFQPGGRTEIQPGLKFAMQSAPKTLRLN